MEKFEKVTEPRELEFYSIEEGQYGKQIHIGGYLYTNGEDNGEGAWREVEYSFFIEPLADFIKHYTENAEYVNDTAAELKQYMHDCTDEAAVDIINNYFDGKSADYDLHYGELTIDTPCGNYCFEF